MHGISLLNVIQVDPKTLSSGKLKKKDLTKLKEKDVKYIINLTDDETLEDGEDERTATEEIGITRYSIPVSIEQPKITNFIDFCQIYSMIHDDKKVVHCDVNYRAVFFIAHYNILFLGWDWQKAEAMISRIWDPQEYSAWHQLSKEIKDYIREKQEDNKLERKKTSIINVIRHILMDSKDGPLNGGRKHALQEKLTWWIMQNKPIEFILPGFPLKSPNKVNKVIGQFPDQAEYSALQNLNNLCASISAVYEPGSVMNIFSDCATFTDILNIPESVGEECNSRLKDLNKWPNIQWHSYGSMHHNRNKMTVAEILQVYKEKNNLRGQVKPKKEEIQATHEILTLELFSDKENLTSEQNDTICRLAEVMVDRSIGLNEMINYHFIKHVRLNIHTSSSSEIKPIIMFEDERSKGLLPWCLPMKKTL